MRVVPRGRASERTDMTKLRVAFSKFANAPKNESSKMHADISILILLHGKIGLEINNTYFG